MLQQVEDVLAPTVTFLERQNLYGKCTLFTIISDGVIQGLRVDVVVWPIPQHAPPLKMPKNASELNKAVTDKIMTFLDGITKSGVKFYGKLNANFLVIDGVFSDLKFDTVLTEK